MQLHNQQTSKWLVNFKAIKVSELDSFISFFEFMRAFYSSISPLIRNLIGIITALNYWFFETIIISFTMNDCSGAH